LIPFSSLEDCFQPIPAPKIARLKEGIRRFKWWAIVALAMIAFLLLLVLLSLLPGRPLRDPVNFAFLGWTNVGGMSNATVSVSNRSTKAFVVFTVAIIEDQKVQRIPGPAPWLLSANLESRANTTFNLPVTPGTRRAEFKFVCVDARPGLLRVVRETIKDLFHQPRDPMKHYQSTLVVTQ
jgi:hypothetical protein